MTIAKNRISRTLPTAALIVCGLLLGIARAQERPDQQPQSKGATIASLYTDILPRRCKLLESDKELGSSTHDCPGPAGYRLIIEDDDLRMSATVVAPNGEKHPLDYSRSITHHFSSLGGKAEWRVMRRAGKVVPAALIIRVNANENPETREVTSYLAVAKITTRETCVTDRIKPGPAANVEARQAADVSAGKPCLQ